MKTPPPSIMQGTQGPTPHVSPEDKLDAILQCLKRMDRRDRWRTIGGFIRSTIALVPILLVLGSAWYFYRHGDEFLKTIIEQTTQSIAAPGKINSDALLKEFQKYLPKK